MRPPTARPRINEDELDPHAKPLGVAVTVLSEESTFEAGRNAFAVWPRPVVVKPLQVRTLQGRIDCVPKHAARRRRKDGL